MTYFKYKDTDRFRVNRYHANNKCEKARMVLLKSDKIGLKIQSIIRDKEGHFIMIKGTIHQEGIIINLYEPNNRAIPVL